MSKTQDASANSAPPAAAAMGGLGDLSVIRNILFGQQATEFESRFEETFARLDRTDAANTQHFEKLEKELRAALADFSAKTDERFKNLESKLDQTAAQLSDNLAKSSRDDKAAIGKMLIEIGQKLQG